MLLSVYHLTEYRYPEAAQDSFNEVWIHPLDDYRQGVLEFSLETFPFALIRVRNDYFNNQVHNFQLVNPHRSLRVEMKAKVITYQAPIPVPVFLTDVKPLVGRFFESLGPTTRIPLKHDWINLVGFRFPHYTENLHDYLMELTAHIFEKFQYESGSTHVDTGLLAFVELGRGVCQDFAQAMLAVLRTIGVPCRYVSGYLATGVGCTGTHAWVDVFLPGSGWAGYDPTNNCFVDERYVKVAHGRDYDDCPPLKGLRRGGGTEKLTVTVEVDILEPTLIQ